MCPIKKSTQRKKHTNYKSFRKNEIFHWDRDVLSTFSDLRKGTPMIRCCGIFSKLRGENHRRFQAAASPPLYLKMISLLFVPLIDYSPSCSADIFYTNLTENGWPLSAAHYIISV